MFGIYKYTDSLLEYGKLAALGRCIIDVNKMSRILDEAPVPGSGLPTL